MMTRMCLLGTLIVLSACTSTEEVIAPQVPPSPVRGFQIQIHTTDENVDAHEMAEQATVWLASLEEGLVRKLHGSTDIPVEIKWLQPYYRVRVGHFRTREEARGMMAKMSEEFPAAFIVPDTIQ
ncbi:MAG: SPOR domain-containing protein [Rhodothermaceae bacterium]|nr:SPOR domain-containing protein [Rhodothermaceae bacterium]